MSAALLAYLAARKRHKAVRKRRQIDGIIDALKDDEDREDDRLQSLADANQRQAEVSNAGAAEPHGGGDEFSQPEVTQPEAVLSSATLLAGAAETDAASKATSKAGGRGTALGGSPSSPSKSPSRSSRSGVVRGEQGSSMTRVASLEAAREAGAATINYGIFINAVITFVIVAWVLFFLVKGMNRLKKAEEEKPAEPKAPPREEVLLEEIRDLLKQQQS